MFCFIDSYGKVRTQTQIQVWCPDYTDSSADIQRYTHKSYKTHTHVETLDNINIRIHAVEGKDIEHTENIRNMIAPSICLALQIHTHNTHMHSFLHTHRNIPSWKTNGTRDGVHAYVITLRLSDGRVLTQLHIRYVLYECILGIYIESI